MGITYFRLREGREAAQLDRCAVFCYLVESFNHSQILWEPARVSTRGGTGLIPSYDQEKEWKV
jgi:hypothetical protein